MAKKKTKKKNRALLITLISVGAVLLFGVAVAAIVSISPNNNFSLMGNDKNSKLKVDSDFIDEIKDGQYQPLSNTMVFRLKNETGFITTDESDNSISPDKYDLEIPDNWKKYNNQNNNSSFVSEKNKTGYDIWTIPAVQDTGNETIDAKFYTAKEIHELFIERQPGASDQDKVIDKFDKTINGKNYYISIIKFPNKNDNDGGQNYQILYTRLLNEGEFHQSALMGTVTFSENIGENNRSKIINGVADLESTFGGFNEEEQNKND